MRFSILNLIKASAPIIFLILALPLVAQRAELSDQPDTAQLNAAPTNHETNRLEGYFALAGFALVTVLCRKR
jgi:hypothetical protein